MEQNSGKAYRVLTEEEFLREWEPIRSRLFTAYPKRGKGFFAWRPFAPDDWQIVVCAGKLGDTDFLFRAELLPERDRSPWAWATWPSLVVSKAIPCMSPNCWLRASACSRSVFA